MIDLIEICICDSSIRNYVISNRNTKRTDLYYKLYIFTKFTKKCYYRRMSTIVSIKDVRDKLADIIARVEMTGDKVIITKFGKPRAMIVPLSNEKAVKIDLSESFGAWKNRKDIKNTAKWVREMRDKTSLRQ